MKQLNSYLFDAVYNWILDSQYTPYILIDTSSNYISVPREYIQDDRIILNIHPHSVNGFTANDGGLSFLARFNGSSRPVEIPSESLLALYARETSQGLVFQGESASTDLVSNLFPISDGSTESSRQQSLQHRFQPRPRPRLKLRIVK